MFRLAGIVFGIVGDVLFTQAGALLGVKHAGAAIELGIVSAAGIGAAFYVINTGATGSDYMATGNRIGGAVFGRIWWFKAKALGIRNTVPVNIGIGDFFVKIREIGRARFPRFFNAVLSAVKVRRRSTGHMGIRAGGRPVNTGRTTAHNRPIADSFNPINVLLSTGDGFSP
ncbi:hypothetical protein C7H10_03725 [Marinobacter shengliensis]|nr:hypothetical protein C7H10_03725 [Marinobacter shengliensis]